MLYAGPGSSHAMPAWWSTAYSLAWGENPFSSARSHLHHSAKREIGENLDIEGRYLGEDGGVGRCRGEREPIPLWHKD